MVAANPLQKLGFFSSFPRLLVNSGLYFIVTLLGSFELAAEIKEVLDLEVLLVLPVCLSCFGAYSEKGNMYLVLSF